MASSKRGIKRIWAVAAVAGAAALAFGISLFRPLGAPPPRAASPPTLALQIGAQPGSPADPLFQEDAQAHDPTPLFLPTQWNSSEKEVPRREPSQTFENFGAKLVFSEINLALDLPSPTAVPERTADALDSNPPGQPFVGIGRSDSPPPVVSLRSAFLEIVAAGSGQRVFSQALIGLASGVADSPPEGGAWQFMAAVDAAGLVGALVPTVRSGTTSDGYFLDYLVRTFRVGDRLAPGFYRISVGP